MDFSDVGGDSIGHIDTVGRGSRPEGDGVGIEAEKGSIEFAAGGGKVAECSFVAFEVGGAGQLLLGPQGSQRDHCFARDRGGTSSFVVDVRIFEEGPRQVPGRQEGGHRDGEAGKHNFAG